MDQLGTLESDVIESRTDGRSGRRKILIALLVLLALLLGGVAGAGMWISSKFGSIEKIADPFAGISDIEGAEDRPTHAPTDEDGNDKPKPVNFLVLGSDSRISAGDPKSWQAGAQRTDAIMVLQISGDRESVNVMSIPRDSWVTIPGVGHNKVNAAFSFGGPTLAIATVEQLTRIPIDHIAIVDFTSFKNLTDALGGVEITSVSGTKTYNGEEALAFVRERKGLPGGDFDRVRRQQAWMAAVMKKTMTREVLTSPGKMNELFNSVSPYVAFDDQLTLPGLAGLAIDMKDIRADDFNFMTAPYSGTGRSADGQSIVLLSEAEFAALSKAFADDTVADYLEKNPDALRRLDDGVVY